VDKDVTILSAFTLIAEHLAFPFFFSSTLFFISLKLYVTSFELSCAVSSLMTEKL
jgi:hypothetical protein